MNYEYCTRCLDVNERKNPERNISYVLHTAHVNQILEKVSYFWKLVTLNFEIQAAVYFSKINFQALF